MKPFQVSDLYLYRTITELHLERRVGITGYLARESAHEVAAALGSLRARVDVIGVC